MNTTSDLTAPRVSSGPVAGLTLAALLAALGTSVANVALPTLAEEFGIASGRAQWVVLAYLLAMTVTAVQVGRLGDRFGRQRILLIGLLVFLAATLACALAPSFTFLVTARAVQGIGAAVLVALPLAIARDLFPSERLGSVMGVLGTAAAVGTALGPAAGGLLLSAFGWPAMFLAVLPLGVLALVLLIGRLSVLVDGSPGSRRKPSARGGTVALMRTLPFSAALVMNLLVATVMMSTLIVGPFVLTTGLGLSVAGVGYAMAVGPVVAAVSGVIAGRAVDRAGSARGTALGLGIMTLGMVALAVLPSLLGLSGYVLALVTLTPGYQLFLAANNTAALSVVGVRDRGAASGLLSLSRNLGLIAGASVMGAIYAAVADWSVSGGMTVAGASLSGMHVTFGVGACLVVVALAVAAAGFPHRSPGAAQSHSGTAGPG